MKQVINGLVFSPERAPLSFSPAALASAGVTDSEGAPLAPILEELAARPETRKYVLCNCCYADGSAPAGLLAVLGGAVLEGLRTLAGAAGAQPCLAAFEGSETAAHLSALAPELTLFLLPPARLLAAPTALFQAIESGEAMTRSCPDSPQGGGLYGCPTLCQPPEVFFRAAVLDGSPAALLALPDGSLCEAGPDSTCRDLLPLLGEEAPRFLQLGGGGPVVTPDAFERPLLSLLPDRGRMLLDGRIAFAGDETCAVDWLARAMEAARFESCGRCVPCRLGCRQLAEITSAVTRGEANAEDLENLSYVAEGMYQLSACEYGRQTGRLVLTYMEAFGEEFQQHVRRKKCAKLVCKGYISYHVLPNLCQGCDACRDACPEQAILGGPGEIHVVDAPACTRCAACLRACPTGAVTKAGVLKPRTPKQPIPVGTWKR